MDFLSVSYYHNRLCKGRILSQLASTITDYVLKRVILSQLATTITDYVKEGFSFSLTKQSCRGDNARYLSND